MLKKAYSLMVDAVLFGESLSECIKANLNAFLPLKVGDINGLWKQAQASAKKILNA